MMYMKRMIGCALMAMGLCLPSFADTALEHELLVRDLTDTAYIEIQQRANDILREAEQSRAFQAFTFRYQAALEAILQGQTPQDIPSSAELSAEYIDAFMATYRSSGTEERIITSFRAMTRMLPQALQRAGYPDTDRIIEEMIQYTQRNIPVLLIANFYNDPLEPGIAYLTRISEWLYLHCPQYERGEDL